MRKFRLYFDKDKETTWLNEMAAQGWAMTGFFAGLYTFEACDPGRYSYQVDISDRFGSVSENYRELMSEMDIEIIQSWGYWVLLRKETTEGPFELYTDVDSRIEHYTKIRNMFKVVTIIEMLCLFFVTISASFSEEPLIWILVIILSVVVFVFTTVTMRTGDTVRKLKERKTGIEEPRSRYSPVLAIGLVLNAVRVLALEHLPDVAANLIGVLAIVLMLVGIGQTVAGNSHKGEA